MRGKIVILLTILVSASCVLSPNGNKLQNTSWMYCNERFGYTEVTFLKDTLWWCTDFDPMGIPYTFNVLDDSILQIESTVNGSVLNLRYKILREASDSVLEIHFIDSNISVRAERIPLVSIAIEDTMAKHRYLNFFNSRKEELNCQPKEWKDLGDTELPND